nr:aldehyde dehydrogenase family protein [Flavobacteriales bacterium]
GLFSTNENHIQQAFAELEVGGLIINGVPGLRVDGMPYGGVKHSGLGREGPRYAMEEMSERRVLLR